MFKKYTIGVFILFWLALAVNPVHPGIWAMENFLVVIIFPIVLWLDKKYVFTNSTFLILTVFVILHLFGAHFTYEKMSYFKWFSDWLDLERNYYDQVIHFLFGLMLFMTFYEIFYHQGHSRKLSYLFAVLFISAIGGWYEVFEWLGMVIFCREPDCSIYVTQGDVWDTQKDIAYAFIGSIIAMLLHKYLSKGARNHSVNQKEEVKF